MANWARRRAFKFVAFKFVIGILLGFLLSVASLPSRAQTQDFDPTLLAEPAVVRVLSACKGYVADANGKSRPYAVGEVGTGFFINGGGHIITSQSTVELWNRDEDGQARKAICKQRLVRNVVKDITGEEITDTDAEGGETQLNSVRDDNKARVREIIAIANKSLTSEAQSQFRYIGKVLLQNGRLFDFEVQAHGDSSLGKAEDVALIKIDMKDAEAPTLKIQDIVSAASSSDSQTAASKVGDTVTVVGFPLAEDVQDSAEYFRRFFEENNRGETHTKNKPGEATVSGGQISNLEKLFDSGKKSIQIDADIAEGSLGSPVINTSGKVIGIVGFVGADPGIASNIPSVTSSEKVLQFVDRTSVSVNQSSSTDEFYRAGLEAFRREDYAVAEAQFEATLIRFPDHVQAEDLLEASKEAIANGHLGQRNQPNAQSDTESSSSLKVWQLALLGLVAVLVLAMLLKNRIGFPSAAASVDNNGFDPHANARNAPITKGDGGSALPRPALTDVIANASYSSPSQTEATQTEAKARPRITLENPNRQKITFSLVEAEHHIGRDPDWSDLRIPEQGWEIISRHHATFRQEGSEYVIYDGDSQTGSTNKTFLNNVAVPVSTGITLCDGDTLTIGKDPDRAVKMTYSKPSSTHMSNKARYGPSSDHPKLN